MQRAYVFDKARHHLAAVRAHDLPEHQAAVHAGLFFGWAVDRGLVLPWVEDGATDAFAAFRRREISGPVLLEALDGAVLDDQFTDEGLAFVAEYYPPRSGSFLDDYVQTLAAGLVSEYHVPDDAQSAARIAEVLDSRLAAWRPRWDGRRPDLRSGRDAPFEEVLASFVAPALLTGAAVPLPRGVLTLRSPGPANQAAVKAVPGGRVVLLCSASGRADEPALDVGVLAQVEAEPGVVLRGLVRVRRTEWVDEVARIGRFERLEPPEADDFERDEIDRLRPRIARLARERARQGQAPGWLALAASAAAHDLLDGVADALATDREPRLTVLLAPDLLTRLAVVAELLDGAR